MCYCLMAGVDKMNPDLKDGHQLPKRFFLLLMGWAVTLQWSLMR